MSNLATLKFDELPRTGDGRGATEKIARALCESGIDAPSSLYDEALKMAQEGRLSPATERLRMLLCLDPADAEAALLLGKVLAARGQWQEALANVDVAATNGAMLPPGLRDRIELNLRKQVQEAEEHRNRVAAREKGEITSLRNEAKRLRSDNAALEIENEELERKVHLWSSATAIVGGAALAILLAALVFGGGGGDEAEAMAEGTSADDITLAAATPVVEPATPEAASTTTTTTTKPVKAASVTPAAAPVKAAPVSNLPKGVMAVHVVKKGDTLGSISSKYYGKFSDWPHIKKANADVLNGGEALSLGMKLQIPER